MKYSRGDYWKEHFQYSRFQNFLGEQLPQETPRGLRLWRSQYFPLLRNIFISTNTSSQTPATRLPSRSSIPAQLWSTERYNFSSEQFRQLFNSSNHSRSSFQSLHSKLRASSFSPDRQIERRLWNNLTSGSEVTQRFDLTVNNTCIFPFLFTYWAQEVLPFVGRYLSLFEKWSRKVITKRECNRELWVLVQSSGLHASELTKNVFVPFTLYSSTMPEFWRGYPKSVCTHWRSAPTVQL